MNNWIKIYLLIISLFLVNIMIAQEENNLLTPNEIFKPLNIQDEKVDRSLGIKYYNSQEYDKAAVVFKQVFEESKSDYDYKYLLYSLVAIEKYDQAREVIKKYRDKDSFRYIDEGYVYASEGNRTNALKYFNKAINEMAPNHTIISRVASSFRGIREFEYAVKTYEKGRKILKDDNVFANDMGSLYYYMHDYKKMIDEYLKSAEFINNQYRFVLGRFQYYMSNDKNRTIAELLKEELLSRAQNEKEGTFYNELARWFFIQQKKFNLAYMQTIAIDKRNKMDGEPVFDLANISLHHKDYNTALKCYEYILKEYKNTPIELTGEIGVLNVKYKQFLKQKNKTEKQAREIDGLFNKLFEKTGISYVMAEMLIAQSNLKAFYLNDYNTAIKALEDMINTPKLNAKTTAQIKLALADIYLLSGDQWESTLLYSQVEKSMKDESLGQEAKYRNAKLFYYIGEFNWAATKLDILKTSTSSLIANDAMRLSIFIKENLEEDSVSPALRYFSKGELAYFRKQTDVAFEYLDSAANVNAWSVIHDDVLYKKAQIYMDMEDFNTADSLLQQIVVNYPDELLIDEALYYSAYINEVYLNNPEKAKNYYKDLFLNHQSSVFSVIARNRYRNLRGEDVEYQMIDDNVIYAPQIP